MKFTYKKLMTNPPAFSVIQNPKEVRIHTVSCMCDNKHVLTLKRKTLNSEFRLDGGGSALSNWQFRCENYEIQWAADEDNWDKVFELINTGLSLISEVRSR